MKRNYSIDILKTICCFLIIIIHISWNFKEEILPLTRCAVPCFFMISGFFLYQKDGIDLCKIKHTIKHILYVTLWASLLFFLWCEYTNIACNNCFFIPPIRSICSWLVCNNYPFSYHLWYLYAYIYVLLLILFVEKYKKWNYLFLSIPILLSANVVFYFLPFFNIHFPLPIYRNFLFIGLPFFALGSLIKKNFNLIPIGKSSVLIVALLILNLSTLLEAMFLTNHGQNPNREIYLSTPFLSIFMFLLFLSIKVPRPNWLAKIGKRDSLWIYILHPIFIVVVFSVSRRIGCIRLFNDFSPFAVFMATLAFIYAMRIIIKFGSTSYNYLREKLAQ